ncbi:MAG: preprotein translocase subunit SecG [Clostridium sp.]
MENFLFVTEVILGAVVIVSIFLQPSKSDALSGLIQGSKNESFFAKNKSRTKEVLIARTTVVSMALFAINTIALNLVK